MKDWAKIIFLIVVIVVSGYLSANWNNFSRSHSQTVYRYPVYPNEKGWVEVWSDRGFKSNGPRAARVTLTTDTWKVVWSITRSTLPEYREFGVDIYDILSGPELINPVCHFSEAEAALGNSGEITCHKPGTYDFYVGGLGLTGWNIKIYELQRQWWPPLSEKWVEVKNIKNSDPPYFELHFTVTTNTWKVVWGTDTPLGGPTSFSIAIFRSDAERAVWSISLDFERDKPYPPTAGEAICHGADTYDVSVSAFGNWGYTIYEWHPNGTATPT